MTDESKIREIPSVEKILRKLAELQDVANFDRNIVVSVIRSLLADIRKKMVNGDDIEIREDEILSEIRSRLSYLVGGSLRHIINLSGCILHTNLGRSPLAASALQDVSKYCTHYTNLEYRIDDRCRGSRYQHVVDMLITLVQGESALVVNNNAASVLLILSTFAQGKEVVVSRGELIEIGGGFRIPEVMKVSGARLVEVGCTNKTRLSDYEKAISPETALLFKAHRSNFFMKGFVEDVSVESLAGLAHNRGLYLVVDLGSGLLANLPFITNEPTPRQTIASGADLVCFSGDKLLGGPQAGIIVGRSDLIQAMKKNPLLRALRVCKMTIAALQGTLKLYIEGKENEIPVIRSIILSVDEIKRTCERIIDLVREKSASPDISFSVVPAKSVIGGGSLPDIELPSYAIAIKSSIRSENDLEKTLRMQTPSILGRIEDGRLLLDLRTLLPDEEDLLVESLSRL